MTGRPDPVFVLCVVRSGSTLLRSLLDAHPEPPETNLPALCGQLAVVWSRAVVWSLIEGAPLSEDRDAAPPRVPDAAVSGIRRMAEEMAGLGTIGQDAATAVATR